MSGQIQCSLGNSLNRNAQLVQLKIQLSLGNWPRGTNLNVYPGGVNIEWYIIHIVQIVVYDLYYMQVYTYLAMTLMQYYSMLTLVILHHQP